MLQPSSCVKQQNKYIGLKMNKSPLVISFYTAGSLYEEEARQMQASCKNFDVECHIEEVPSRGTWVQNCAIKPSFILEKMLQFQRPVVWVDADARFKGRPVWATFADGDIAVHVNHHYHKEHRAYVETGTLFVNPTPASVQLLKRWEEACKSVQRGDDDGLDQVILARILGEARDVRLIALPLPYIKIIPRDEGLVSAEETIIEHHVVSCKPNSSLLDDDQIREFLKKKKACGLAGIVDYHPSMLRQAGDCCFFPITLCSFFRRHHACGFYV